MKNVFKTIITSILMVTLLMSIVPTGEKAEENSNYQKLSTFTVDCNKIPYQTHVYDGKGFWCEVQCNKPYVQPMSKFNIKLKNLPEGGKTKLSFVDAFEQHYRQDEEWGLQLSGVGYPIDAKKDKVASFKKNSEKSYTVYVKKEGCDLEKALNEKRWQYSTSMPVSWYKENCLEEYSPTGRITTIEWMLEVFDAGGTKCHEIHGLISIFPIEVQKMIISECGSESMWGALIRSSLYGSYRYDDKKKNFKLVSGSYDGKHPSTFDMTEVWTAK